MDIQQQAAGRAEELPGSELTHPFGEDWDVWKVRDKVFMLQTQVTGQELVTLKANPEGSVALRKAYENITPGYHMNKKHWISVAPASNITATLVDELVTESYLLVVEKLPRAIRPVDPDTFRRN